MDGQKKPACSCHLRYGLVSPDELLGSREWRLECTVCVEESADCTYFCVVGWGPGGYSGLQQLSGGKRMAIFSMWDDGKGNGVEAIERGDDVVVSGFDGEGTGLKTMAELDWKEGQMITFVVEGRQVPVEEAERETWEVSCVVITENEKLFLAKYRRRSSQRPLNECGFYSFVEDWDRRDGCDGHLLRRAALFLNPALTIDRKKKKSLTSARFTKVEWGFDCFAKEKARGGAADKPGFFLSTGGPSPVGEEVPNGRTFQCTKKEG